MIMPVIIKFRFASNAPDEHNIFILTSIISALEFEAEFSKYGRRRAMISGPFREDAIHPNMTQLIYTEVVLLTSNNYSENIMNIRIEHSGHTYTNGTITPKIAHRAIMRTLLNLGGQAARGTGTASIWMKFPEWLRLTTNPFQRDALAEAHAALSAIASGYGRIDISHEDYRVGAARMADQALAEINRLLPDLPPPPETRARQGIDDQQPKQPSSALPPVED